MRLSMESRECTDSMDGVCSSSFVKKRRLFERATIPTAQLLQRRFHFLSCIIILSLAGVQNAGLATAGIVLPVIRSFSQQEGSGTDEGSLGMTAEHAKELRHHDYQRNLRHNRILTTVADFPLAGNEYYVGLYYTEIGLGTPADLYFVQVDTGSDLLWVNCKPCLNCPANSDLQIKLRLYDPAASKTSTNTSCSSTTCKTVATIANNLCVDDSCYYSFSYGDGSTAMGYLVDDLMTYDTVVTNSSVQNMTANIVFGCGFNQSGDSLTSSFRAVDGIMGFGRQVLSAVTQLADAGLTTSAFAHCLQGDTGQGGIFVIGDVQEPGLVFTKMLANQYHYNVVLQSISVGGTDLNIPPSVFDVNNNNGEGGTIFDSGTTMALLVDTAYDAFLNQLTAVVTVPAVSSQGAPDTPCFEYSSSDLSAAFPSVTLGFDGASMELVPTNYLYKQSSGPSNTIWCLAWSPSSSSGLDGLSILGDIVLKNKLVVYDLGNEQIGWVDYNCLSSVSVSNGTGNQVLDPREGDFTSGPSHSLQAYHPAALLLGSLVVAYAVALL